MVVENKEYAAFALRILRAMNRRATDDVEALPLLAQIAAEADLALNRAIIGCHAEGFSTAEIGARLGITRQAVHQRIQRQGGIDTDPAVAGVPG